MTSLAVELRRAEERLRHHLEPHLGAEGMSLDHWRIIAVLHDQPGLGMSALAELAVVPAASLTRYVDRLVETGVVVRRIDPDDRRRVSVALSVRGRRIAGLLADAERAAVEDVRRPLVGHPAHG